MSVCIANGYHLCNEYAYTCALRIYFIFLHSSFRRSREKKVIFKFFLAFYEILSDTQLGCVHRVQFVKIDK